MSASNDKPAVITHLFIKPVSRAPMVARQSLILVSGKGILNDAAFGRSKRQILLVSHYTLMDFQLSPGDLRENITVQGLHLRELQAGTILRIDETELEITGLCTPCDRMNELRPGLRKDIVGRRGVLARCLSGGLIRAGAAVEAL